MALCSISLGGAGTTRSTPPPIRRRTVQERPCTVRGQQGHDPLPALRARPREVDRTHREVPREGSRRARQGEGGRAEEARGPRYGAQVRVAEPGFPCGKD